MWRCLLYVRWPPATQEAMRLAVIAKKMDLFEGFKGRHCLNGGREIRFLPPQITALITSLIADLQCRRRALGHLTERSQFLTLGKHKILLLVQNSKSVD